MAYKLRQFVCERCGTEYERREPPSQEHLCFECRLDKMREWISGFADGSKMDATWWARWSSGSMAAAYGHRAKDSTDIR